MFWKSEPNKKSSEVTVKKATEGLYIVTKFTTWGGPTLKYNIEKASCTDEKTALRFADEWVGQDGEWPIIYSKTKVEEVRG